MEAPQELHRRPTLLHFMSRVDSSNLRDLLKVRQDDADAASRRRSGDAATRTLATVLACEKRDMGSNAASSSSSTVSSVTKTLLDIIRDEHEPHQHRISTDGSASIGVVTGPNRGGGGVVNWKALRDRLRLRRANEGLQGAAFGETSQHRNEEDRGSNSNSSRSSPAVSSGGPRPLISILELESGPPQSPAPDRGGAMTAEAAGNTSGRIAVGPPSAATPATTTTNSASTSTPSGGEEPRTTNPSATSMNRPHPPAQTSRQQRPQSPQDEPTRVSLMALLEQADRTGAGAGGPPFAAAVVSLVEDGHGEEVKQTKAGTGSSAGVEESVCCVCMVRHKGAAFIPCGHTFCRVCTRELWVSRGTCPLCNGFILDILDIF